MTQVEAVDFLQREIRRIGGVGLEVAATIFVSGPLFQALTTRAPTLFDSSVRGSIGHHQFEIRANDFSFNEDRFSVERVIWGNLNVADEVVCEDVTD